MALSLRRAPDGYDRDDQSQMRSDLERADRENLKRGTFYDEARVFTPTVFFGGAAVGVTYSKQVGRAFRFGRRVEFDIYIVLTSNGSSTGLLTVGTLPFISANITDHYSAVSIWANGLTGMSGHLQAYIAQNSSVVTFSYLGTGTANDLDDTKVTDTASFIITGSYETSQ